MEIDNRSRFLAAIDPANSFGARVRETLEIDLQIDLVGMLVWGLRVQLLTVSREANAHENAERENLARRYVFMPFVHLRG